MKLTKLSCFLFFFFVVSTKWVVKKKSKRVGKSKIKFHFSILTKKINIHFNIIIYNKSIHFFL